MGQKRTEFLGKTQGQEEASAGWGSQGSSLFICIGVGAIPDKTSMECSGTSQVVLEFFLDKECATGMTSEGNKQVWELNVEYEPICVKIGNGELDIIYIFINLYTDSFWKNAHTKRCQQWLPKSRTESFKGTWRKGAFLFCFILFNIICIFLWLCCKFFIALFWNRDN